MCLPCYIYSEIVRCAGESNDSPLEHFVLHFVPIFEPYLCFLLFYLSPIFFFFPTSSVQKCDPFAMPFTPSIRLFVSFWTAKWNPFATVVLQFFLFFFILYFLLKRDRVFVFELTYSKAKLVPFHASVYLRWASCE